MVREVRPRLRPAVEARSRSTRRSFSPYPKTLGYSEHLLGIAVFTAPLQWLTANPLLVYNLAFLASYALAGVGMYLLVRSLTGRRDAAFVAGAAFAFGPFRDGQIAHLQMLMSGWMPIALWALHRYFASGRRWALGAFVVTFLIQGLSNGYFLYFFSVPVALVLGHGLWKTCLPRGRVLAELAVAGLLMFAVLAPVGLMYHGLSREQPFARSRGSIVNGAADLFSYTSLTRRRPTECGCGAACSPCRQDGYVEHSFQGPRCCSWRRLAWRAAGEGGTRLGGRRHLSVGGFQGSFLCMGRYSSSPSLCHLVLNRGYGVNRSGFMDRTSGFFAWCQDLTGFGFRIECRWSSS